MNYQGSVISARERELLLLRAQTGDQEALGVLFESCRRRLYCQALRILGRPQDAEDAVQEAMLASFTHLQRFQRRADFLTWATRIVINAALQHIRKTRTRSTIPWDQADSEFEGPSSTEYRNTVLSEDQGNFEVCGAECEPKRCKCNYWLEIEVQQVRVLRRTRPYGLGA